MLFFPGDGVMVDLWFYDLQITARNKGRNGYYHSGAAPKVPDLFRL